MSRETEIKVALWVFCMAVIGLAFLVLPHRSGAIMAAHAAAGYARTSVTFWLPVTVILLFRIAMFVLLKKAEPLEFRVSALLF